ncbi:hypothetical protein B0H19DRAFT_1313358 [Mycena capillaripes]|nr:hypothetical protein B0H19DRAFT_1313358 [Mycena capillaripes]
MSTSRIASDRLVLYAAHHHRSLLPALSHHGVERRPCGTIATSFVCAQRALVLLRPSSPFASAGRPRLRCAMPMPVTAIRRLVPSILEATLICLVSSLTDVLSSRPAAVFPLPPTRLPAIFSGAYSRMLEGSSMKGALAPGLLLHEIRLYVSTARRPSRFTSGATTHPVHEYGYAITPFLHLRPRASRTSQALFITRFVNAWGSKYQFPCLTSRRIPALADVLKPYSCGSGQTDRNVEDTSMEKSSSPRPVPSICRVDVYLRRGPPAPRTGGICRRDSLARPSSQSGRYAATLVIGMPALHIIRHASKTEHQLSTYIAQNSLTVRVAITATANEHCTASFEALPSRLLFYERVRDTTTFFASSSPSTQLPLLARLSPLKSKLGTRNNYPRKMNSRQPGDSILGWKIMIKYGPNP